MFDALVKQENGKDSLTQLLNRRFIPTIMRREISLALHARKPFSTAMLDIDYFKQINDNFGHNTGDLTLKTSQQSFMIISVAAITCSATVVKNL